MENENIINTATEKKRSEFILNLLQKVLTPEIIFFLNIIANQLQKGLNQKV
ncbi:hypothetical protein KA996_02600 [bacterium]|jgi:hypothetical protein|nr:hypothetical protein [bacterium]